ncbi:Nif3-like dinuclear metal center hexameric protein [Naumannella halotolerans]|uniref:GTP cyclohydrolase 1 type 2 homolog n=1 Tax=Naumannella halotolerans TaxID=993414 RepID=A0A4R7JC46_9ACTN|nr:Nif3-like dinuclear metal center hexameric protein [Naumannella halotolerans]TDT34029.1 dinuclear metal center YbgI/SA1388 family protein [Naumannella halotolerans]
MAGTVGELTELVHRHWPPSTAESWDRVGLVCGDREATVDKVLLSVDVTWEVVRQAQQVGAQMIIAHHPLLLKGIHSVDPQTPKGRILTELISSGIALVCAHTNADIAADGVSQAMAEAIGLIDLRPLVQRQRQPARDQLVVQVPTDHLTELVDALSEAGAGAIGDYDRCYFASDGTGSFRPGAGANPYLGTPGEIEQVAETRVEMIMPRTRRDHVVAALRRAHPYEEPAWHVIELPPEPSAEGLGRIGTVRPPMRLADFAARVADALPATVSGVRVSGDPDALIGTVALLGGAGDSELSTAAAAGVDAYLTSDLRHHPASEFREAADAPALLDVSHWAAEWTWLPLLGRIIAAETSAAAVVSELRTDAWNFAVHRAG